jgi:hypothetical protein
VTAFDWYREPITLLHAPLAGSSETHA